MLERSTHVGAHRRGRVITIDWRRDGRDARPAAPDSPRQDRPVGLAVAASGAAEWAVRVERRLADVLGAIPDGLDRSASGPWTVEDLREEVLRARGDARINAYVVRPTDSEPVVIVAPFEGRRPRKTFCRMGMRMQVAGVEALVDAFVGAPVWALLQPAPELRRAPFYVVGLAGPRHAASTPATHDAMGDGPVSYRADGYDPSGYETGQRRRYG